MFSCIIPTMWKIDNLKYELKKLNENKNIKEIILINNDVYNTPEWFNFSDYSKLCEIKLQNNIFINPAWNLGVINSSCENLMIHSDDMISNYKFLDEIDKKIRNEDCLIGIGETCYIKNNDKYFFENMNDQIRPMGWGATMFLRKSSYKALPFKIWNGDDLLIKLFKKRKKSIYKLQNADMSNSIIAGTEGLPEFEIQIKEDGFLNEPKNIKILTEWFANV